MDLSKGMEIVKEKLDPLYLRALFYLVTPNETSVEKLEDVPNYIDGALPYFFILIILEVIVLWLQGRDLPPLADSMNSASHGLLSFLVSFCYRVIELMVYVWVYDNFCLVKLPWNNPWVWFATFITLDFLYYWFHRFSHEVNLLWASHQVHHSSEEFNLATGLRLSAVQKYFNMVFNIPVALCIPPSLFWVHSQFVFLYQFWIHTETVSSLGPLEYILNTPSHHRVHHGRNPYCIDKNYGGTLIIWDRIFGTFGREGEKVTYGLVHPNEFWDPIKGQVYYFLHILGLVKSHEGLGNKISAVIKGPGWVPGSPWSGNPEDIPELEHPVKKYGKPTAYWIHVYIWVHFLLINLGYAILAPLKESLPEGFGISFVCFALVSLYTFGALYDHRPFAETLEVLRCFLFIALALYHKGPALSEEPIGVALVLIHTGSIFIWNIIVPLYRGDQSFDDDKDLKKMQ